MLPGTCVSCGVTQSGWLLRERVSQRALCREAAGTTQPQRGAVADAVPSWLWCSGCAVAARCRLGFCCGHALPSMAAALPSLPEGWESPGLGWSQGARPRASSATAWPLLAQLLAASWSGPLSHPLAHIFIRNMSSLERVLFTAIAEGSVSDTSFSWFPSPVTYCCPWEKRSYWGQIVWVASQVAWAVLGGLCQCEKWSLHIPAGGNDWTGALGSMAWSAWAPGWRLLGRCWAGTGSGFNSYSLLQWDTLLAVRSYSIFKAISM